MDLIRGTALEGIEDLVASFGADAGPLLRRAGIPRAAVGDHDAFISFRALVKVMESAAAVTGAPDFGRRLALRQGIEILGPVGAAALSAPTFGDALVAASRYLSTYSPALEASLSDAGRDRRLFEIRVILDRLGDHRQQNELSIAVAFRMLRLLAGGGFSPVAVHVPHDPLTAREDYLRYFGTKVRFAEPLMGFTLRTRDLHRPIGHGGELHKVVRSYLDSALADTDADLVRSTTTLIRHLLPTGSLKFALVARQLDLHPRTLQRRLAERSETFDGLVDQVRRDVATHLLRDSDMPLSQLAGVLGYSEQSAFTRRSHAWFSMAPTAYRRALRSAHRE
ncbi:AraC family transcriptional regulator [Nocardioides ultimimeridianus]